MAKNTLTAGEWNQLFALPADGQKHHVEGIAFVVIHKPATKMHVEQIIAETRYGTLRRRFVGGRWQATEYI